MSLNNFLKEHLEIIGGTTGGVIMHIALSENLITHLINVAWSLGTAFLIFNVLHYYKQYRKWKD